MDKYTNVEKAYNSRYSVKKYLFRLLTPHFLREKVQRLRGQSKFKHYFDRHKCIFVHIPKAAGQSLGESLFNDPFPGHWKLTDYEWENRKKTSSYFTFAISRNPYDRLVSAYFYLMNSTKSELDRYFVKNVLIKYPTFEEFVLNGLLDEEIIRWVHFVPQTEFIKTKNGRMIDYVGKLETMDEAVGHICEKLGVSNVEVPKKNESVRKDYNGYYTKQMKDVVYDFYQKDFEVLGYSY